MLEGAKEAPNMEQEIVQLLVRPIGSITLIEALLGMIVYGVVRTIIATVFSGRTEKTQ